MDVDLANQTGPFASGWDGETLTKEGAGTLILDYQNTYIGATIINNGTLRTNINDAFAQSGALKIAGSATLDLNGYSQSAQDLSGAGMVNLNGAELTVASNNDTVFSGNIIGSGSFNKTGTATLTLTGTNTQDGTTQIAEGRLIVTGAGALGTAAINNSSELELAFANDGVIASQIQGSGHLIKSGGGNAVLNGPSFVQIEITVSGGTLTLGEAINYYAGHSYTTQNGATTTLASGATLYGGQTFTQEAGATLNVTVGGDEPIITAGTAAIDGTLRVTGLDLTGRSARDLDALRHVIIQTQNGGVISGDFSELDLGGAQSTVDYLTLAGRKEANDTQYVVGLGLTWFAGPTTGHGTFTLTQAADSFNVDVALTDQSLSQTGWDGRMLTLSAANEYSGQTVVNSGTLQAGIIDTIALSSGLTVNSGATFDLNGFAQSIQSLSGSGTVALGASALTVNGNASSTFGGNLTGSGQLIKNGAGNLTMAGNNSPYTGNVTINSGGIVAANGNALGSGNVAINSPGTLTLDFSADGSMANVFSGNGNLTKTGAYTTTLTGLNSQVGNVNVNQGGLTFGQTGAFSASGNLIKNGGGSLTLSGSNMYDGNTTVNAGQLIVTAGTALGGGAVNNNAELTLAFRCSCWNLWRLRWRCRRRFCSVRRCR